MEDIKLIDLFQSYQLEENAPVLELQDKDHKPVGALYFKLLRYKNIAINQTNNSEKYCLIIDGVLIYFSYFKKIYTNNI